MNSGVARAPQAPRPLDDRDAEGALKRPARKKITVYNPLARGPNNLFAGGPKNRPYVRYWYEYIYIP